MSSEASNSSAGHLSTESLASLRLRPGYSTGRGDLISDFYVPCLSAASSYDRAVGYFRSSLFVLVGLAFSNFALRGGKTRLICSPYLGREDVDAISQGVAARETVDTAILTDLRNLLQTPHNRPAVELLATLVAYEALEIRLAFRPSASGIFHDKVGIFYDQHDNRVSFLGSTNETFSAWASDANHEGFEVFRSWTSDSDRERVIRHADYFETLWSDQEHGVRTVAFAGVAREELLALKNPDGIDPAAANVRQVVSALSTATQVTLVTSQGRNSRPTLLSHQRLAVENWFAAGHRGLVDHATGSGKTITALEIIQRWIQGGRPAIVFVPTELLLEQWHQAAAGYLDRQTAFLLAGAGHGRDTWIRHLPDFTRNATELGPRLTIATMQSGSTSDFRSRVQRGIHLLLVADEVHRIGSTSFQRILEIEAGGRLGLSATPKRFGDPEGTAAIHDYFGAILPPPFGLREALASGRLVPYDYYVHLVPLTADEQTAWNEMSERIAFEFARLPQDDRGGKRLTSGLRLLFIQRAAILKRAQQKATLAQTILEESFEEGDRWLIYCDTQEQLRDVMDRLKRTGLEPLEYHSSMFAARTETLQAFETKGGILVAIRCLDEGVDIPLVNRALILASSTNPREFIQRRGRVLRSAPSKYSAAIHDALVVGSDGSLSSGALFPGEVRRALQFAEHARNAAVRHRLRLLLPAGHARAASHDEDIEDEA
jgi:superfamily II DNA or RNA helicase